MKFFFSVDGKRQEVSLTWGIWLLRAAIQDGKSYGCLEFTRRADA